MPNTARIWPWRCSLPAHPTTTAHLQGLYPFLAEAGLGGAGIYIGRDLFGGSFCWDPWQLYAAGVLSNPNLLIIGDIGSRKSTLVKTLLWRGLAFGRRFRVTDPKGEYGPLAQACGASVIKQAPGLGVILNPLDLPVEVHTQEHVEQLAQRRLELLGAIAATTLDRPLSPVETTGLELALAAIQTQVPTLPDVTAHLLEPEKTAARQAGMPYAEYRSETRDIALGMRRLCTGDLAGMFDGPTSPNIDAGAQLLLLDLSAVYHRAAAALPLVMTCATAWLTGGNTLPAPTFQVTEEAWATLGSLPLARAQRAAYKLARRDALCNIAVLHRLSDLSAAGAAGSEQVALARGLLEDAGTRVVFAQPPGETRAARDLLGLTDTETDLLPHLPAGTALWKVGRDRSFIVQHRLADAEMLLVDTDSAMRA
jgi:type IV secretory pathway VirB4 component